MYWASLLGIPGAAAVEQYALEPLLVVGLMIGETARLGVTRTLIGTTAVRLIAWSITSLVSASIISTWVAYIITFLLLVAGLTYAFREVKRGWAAAAAGRARWGT